MSNQKPFYLWKLLEGEREHDRFGDRIVCGDINGDGLNEWIISASTATQIDGEGGVNPIAWYYTGRVYVFSSQLDLLFTIDGENPGDCFGSSLALGDLNGDGIQEIIVGAPSASHDQWMQCGMIAVYSGITGELLQKWYGLEDHSRIGCNLAILDWDEDGIPDVAASSHLSDPSGTESCGKVTIFSGNDGRILEQFIGAEKEKLGFSLTTGDVNGDGKDEIIIGAPYSSNSGFTRNGRLMVYSREKGLIHESTGKRSYDYCSHFVTVGDMDGNGIADLLIGSPMTTDKEYRGGMLTVFSVANNRIILEKGGWFGSQGLGICIHPFVDPVDGSKKILAGSKIGSTYLIDMNGKVVHEFNGYEGEIFSHSLAVGDGNEGQRIAIGAVSGLNRKKFMSGSVYMMSSIPPSTAEEGPNLPAKTNLANNLSLTNSRIGTGPHTGPGTAPGTGPGTQLLPFSNQLIRPLNPNRMKILLCTYWYLPHVGGVDVYVRTLKKELEKRGHQVDVLAHHPDMAHYYLVDGVKSIDKWQIKRVIYDKVFPFYQRYLPHVEPWVRYREIERYCFEAAATLFDLEEYDLIHTQDIVSTRALSRVKPASTPLVATIHGLLAKEHLISGDIENRDNLAWKYVSDEEHYGCVSADATIVPTEWLRREMIDFEVPVERLTVIPYGMDIDLFKNKMNQSSPEPSKKETFTISCPARLVPVKGHRTLLEALNQLQSMEQSWHCWLIGDGPLRADIEQLILNYGLTERVTMLGDRNDVPALLKQSDLMVLPSLQDNLPFSIMEAQVAGTPIVASNAGGIPEMIRHEQTGLLFEVGQAGQLAQQIQRMITDSTLRENVAQNAKDWAYRQWSAATLLNRTLQVYETAYKKVRR